MFGREQQTSNWREATKVINSFFIQMNWIFLEIRLFYGREYNAVQFSHTLLVLVGRLIEHKAPELEKVMKRKVWN